MSEPTWNLTWWRLHSPSGDEGDIDVVRKSDALELVGRISGLEAKITELEASLSTALKISVIRRESIDKLEWIISDLRKDIAQLEAQQGAEPEEPGYIGTVEWNGWKVDLVQEDDDDA